MTAIKVCGLRRRADVELCVELGVEMLGVNCWAGSPRFVAEASRGELIAGGIGDANLVLVFVRAEPDEVKRVVASLTLDPSRVWVQLHGDEDPELYADVGASLVQVLRLGDETDDVPAIAATRVLLDVRASRYGGTGRRLDEDRVTRVAPRLPSQWMLAGGLDPSNVSEVTARTRPWGVDVASGVETAPGVKSHTLIRAFVDSVRNPLETTPGART